MAHGVDAQGTAAQNDRLQPLDEDWSVGLAIVAHPDDLEYGAAAAVARWTAQGKRISYVLVTSGEAGIAHLPPEAAGLVREQEERTAAAVVGVNEVQFLGYPDGVLEPGLPLRRDLARAIRRHRPEVVLTGNFHPVWPMGGPNQADHMVVGRAVIDGVRDAANRWIFRELIAEGHEPWDGVRTALVAGSPHAAHGVDVTDHLRTGIKSLEAHTAYLAGLGGGPMADPAGFLKMLARRTGERLGCQYGTSFEMLPLSLGPR